jgi:hypothetical protein
MKAAAVFPDKKSLGVVQDFPEPKLESPSGVKPTYRKYCAVRRVLGC